MPQSRPNPEGWKGGPEDFGFIRTFDGHISTDRYHYDDGRSHRNAKKSLADADLNGLGYGLEDA